MGWTYQEYLGQPDEFVRACEHWQAEENKRRG